MKKLTASPFIKKSLLLFLLMFILKLSLRAQCTGVNCGPNLIPNPSFELTTSDCNVSSLLHTNRSPVQGWYGVAASTGPSGGGTHADYFSIDCIKKATENCGDGNGSVGIFTYNLRESIQAKLLSSLKPGHLYCFSMKVKSWPSGATDNDGIGAWFHNRGKIDIDVMNNNKQFLGAGSKINASPQIKNPSGNMITGTCKTISGTFCATGGESWVVISNFKTNETTNHSALGYVIIDEVSLTEINCLSLTGISSPADSACPGACVPLTAEAIGGNGSYTYLWSPGGETTKSINACAASIPVQFKCTVTSSVGCGKNISVTDSFTLYPKEHLPVPQITASGSTTICSTDSITLTSSPAPSYLWSPDQQKTQSITIGKAGTYKVTVKHPLTACNTASAEITVVVKDLPQIDVKNMISDSTSCGLHTGAIKGITVTGVPPLLYSWNGGPQTSTSPDLIGAGVGTHTLTVTDGNGCSKKITGHIWNKETPDSVQVQVTSGRICEGEQSILYVTPADPSITYTWITPSKTSVLNDSLLIIKAKLQDAGTYTITATKNNCTSPEVYTTLLVDTAASSEKPVVSNAKICQGDTVTINAAQYIAGVTYFIYTQASGGVPIGVAPLKVAPMQTTIYFMEASSSNGCRQLTARDTVTVHVYKAPVVQLPTVSNAIICEGKTTVIDVQNPQPGVSYQVYDALTGGTLLGLTPLTVTLTKTSTFYIGALSSQGCKQITSRLPITVNVNPTPVGPKISIENITGNYICDGLSAKLISSIPSGITWSTGATTPFIVVTKAGTYTVYYTDTNGCASLKDSVEIDIKIPPKVQASGLVVDTVPCYENTGGIHGIAVTGGTMPYTYAWFNSNDLTKVLSTSLILQGVPSGTYTLVVSDKNGCKDKVDKLFIPSKGGVVASLSGTPLTGYDPLTIDLLATNSGVGQAIGYVWMLDGHKLASTDSITNTYTIKDLHFGEHIIAVTVTDTNGCKSVDYLKIMVHTDVEIFDVNIFTPNNDGKNDLLVFPLQGVQSLHVKIYDRWGLQLFEWNDPEKGWDGNTESGKPVPEGTYYYVIDFVDLYGNKRHQAGHVQLMRN
jgi:gliding motility-associated-like protein